jgi:hypothetical protein
MKVLAVATEPISAGQLRGAVGERQAGEAEIVLVVVPALHRSAIRFWVSDADEAIQRARQGEHERAAQLRHAGVTAGGEVGDIDVVDAVRDALATFDPDRIVLFTHAPDVQRHREGVTPAELSEEFGIAVERIEIGGGSPG